MNNPHNIPRSAHCAKVAGTGGLRRRAGGRGDCPCGRSRGTWDHRGGRGARRRVHGRARRVTGVGGGLVLDGKPYLGRTGNAGHIGHVVVEDDGRGGRAPAAAAAASRRSRRARTSCAGRGSGVAGAGVGGRGDAGGRRPARRRDPAVGVSPGWPTRSGSRRAATAVVCDLGPAAVIGGGVAQAGDLLLDPVRGDARRARSTVLCGRSDRGARRASRRPRGALRRGGPGRGERGPSGRTPGWAATPSGVPAGWTSRTAR